MMHKINYSKEKLRQVVLHTNVHACPTYSDSYIVLTLSLFRHYPEAKITFPLEYTGT